MKISRRDLRKIILESILSEQSGATTSGAGRTRGRGPGMDDDERVAFSEYIISAVDNVLNKEKNVEEFSATFAIGRASVNIYKETAKVNGETLGRSELRALVAKIKAALKADDDISADRELLRPGRRLTTTYRYKPNGQSEAVVSEVPDESSKEEGCDATLKEKTKLDLFGLTDPTNHTSSARKFNPTVAHGFQYPGDNTYRYYVSTVDGCWYALNTDTCKLFSMKKYPSNMKNLDREFPNARDQGLIDKCAGRTSSTSNTPNTPNTPTAPSPKPGANLTLREEALIMLMAAGTGNRLPYRGADLAILFETGTTDAYKEVIAQVKRQTDINSLQNAANRFATPKSQPNGLLDLGNVTGGFNYTQAQNQHGVGGALKLALKRGAAFDLPGLDDASFNRNHMNDLRDALGKYLNAPKGTLNESAYGKSRGTLLRERYWGRY